MQHTNHKKSCLPQPANIWSVERTRGYNAGVFMLDARGGRVCKSWIV